MITRKRVLYILLAALCAIAAIKMLFVGYDIDEQYAVSMAYRILKGDRLLVDMWEPHQTSGWLCTLLMVPYAAVFHTTTGIVLYLRACGLLLHGAVGFCLYRTLRGYLDREHAFLNSCIYFFALPKIMFLPEFSNIQIWCLMMAVLCMVRYYGVQTLRTGNYALRELVLAGCFMALEVLSYPSTIIAFVVCVGSVVCYRRCSPHSSAKELSCLMLPCVLGALIFVILILTYVPLTELWELVSIVASDGSHSAPWTERLLQHGQSLKQILLLFLVYASAASVLAVLYQRKQKASFSVTRWCGLLIGCTLVGQVCIWIFGDQYPNYPMVEYFFVPLLFLGAVIRHRVYISPAVAFLVLMPMAAFAGVLLFSNHPLMVSLPFLSPCVVGILSLPQQQENATANGACDLRVMSRELLILWVCVLLLGRCYMQRTTGGRHETILDDMSLMRTGPAKGLVADTDAVIRYRDNYELINNVLPENAKVFYIGANSDVYLMKELEYCIPSTICTPTFDDTVFYYFQQHPSKQPEYIVCDTGLLYSNLWVANYIGEVCQDTPVGESDYLRIYRVREN